MCTAYGKIIHIIEPPPLSTTPNNLLGTNILNQIESNSLYLSEPSIKTLLVNLTKLQVLYLDGVNISSNGSEWGPAVSQLVPTLRRLSLSGCSLVGLFDQSLIRLSQI